MKLTPIDDLDLPEIAIYKALRDNAFSADESFIADSPKVVNLLLEKDIKAHTLLATPNYYEEFESLIKSKAIKRLYVADRKVMESIIGHKMHHNVMMHGRRPAPQTLDAMGDHLIMLDHISSSENVGTIARTAAALGVKGYLLPHQGPHPYGRRALRVSMGYISMLDYHLFDDIFETLSKLKQAGYTILAAEVTPEAIEVSLLEIPKKWVLLMGHEGTGLSQELIDACDITVRIDMVEGVKSLNVAVAASIILYHLKAKQTNPIGLK